MTVFIHATLKLNEIKKIENLISFCRATTILFAYYSYDESNIITKHRNTLFYAQNMF